MSSTMQFSGVELFSVPPAKLFAVVTDLDALAATIPDITSAERVDERTLRCVVRPGFSFLRGTLHTTIEIAELQPPESALMRIASQGIGATVKIESRLSISPTDDGGSRLDWTAAVTELKGLVATISRPLIQAAAEKTISKAWHDLRLKVEKP